MTDDEILEKAKQRYKDARDYLSVWRQEAREDFDFVSGDQWTPEDRQMLQEQQRPVITFNRIGPLVDSVAGVEVQNRQETKYMPRTVEDTGVNEVLTAAAAWRNLMPLLPITHLVYTQGPQWAESLRCKILSSFFNPFLGYGPSVVKW